MDTVRDDTRTSKSVLAIGYLALLVGTLAAFRKPATGYELSIYAATPGEYWIGLAIALAVSLAISFGERASSRVRDGALLLATLAVTSAVALPLVRGYHHFGSGDAMTHLGWMKDIAAGRLDPVNMLYPGVHATAIFVSNVVGVTYSDAQLLVVVAYFLVFVAFVTLCVRLLGRAAWATPVGLFSALLVLPNNNVSVHLMAHPITQSLFVLPLILYLVLKYVNRAGESTNRLRVATPMGVLLGLTAVAVVFVHPQGASNVVAVLIGIALLQLFVRRFEAGSAIHAHRPVYVPTAIATVALVLWAPRHERVRATARLVVDSLLGGSVPADEITQRSASLSELGASLGSLFVKLFLVAALFCVLAGALIAAWYAGRLGDRYARRNAAISYLVVTLVPLTGAFLVFFASSATTQHFRYVGFLMVPVTILGALAISAVGRGLRNRSSDENSRAALVACFFLLLALPLATLHASPFIYQPSAGVSAQAFDGAETTFDRMDRDVAFAGVRGGPDRLLDGVYGTERAAELGIRADGPDTEIPGSVFGSNLTSYYDGPRYVTVSESDVAREVRLYDGFRYSARGFERLDSSPAIDRVYANGGYRLYLLHGDDA